MVVGLPLVLDNYMQLVNDLLGRTVRAAGVEFGVQYDLVERTPRLIEPASEGRFRPEFPLDIAARVAGHFVADCPDVLRHIQHDGPVFKILDLEFDDHFAVEQISGHPLLLVLVDRANDDHVLRRADVQLHLVVQWRELPPSLRR